MLLKTKSMIIRIIWVFIVLFGVYQPVSGQETLMVSEHDNYILRGADMELVIDGQMGARVTSFKLGVKEILGTEELHPIYYGSTLWLGPQGKWRPKVVDALAYTSVKENNKVLSLKSQKDSLNGFSITKNFRIHVADSSVEIRYKITNISNRPKRVSPWEVTRVPTGGMVFFPKGGPKDVPTGHKGMPYLKIEDNMGIIWYPYDRLTKSAEKLFMNGSEGWLAYARDETLFIKKFPVIDLSKVAPGEKNVEIYANKEKTYLELENQGRYQLLAPGSSLNYKVVWYARKLEPDWNQNPGNYELIDYVRKVIR